MSIVWELLEYSLKFQLANFAECWWDSWLLDVLICNGSGIILGMLTCHFLEIKKYHWETLASATTLRFGTGMFHYRF